VAAVSGATLIPTLDASATSVVRSFEITSNLPTSLSNSCLVAPALQRRHESEKTCRSFRLGHSSPPMQQISAHDVQAVVTGSLKPAAIYTSIFRRA